MSNHRKLLGIGATLAVAAAMAFPAVGRASPVSFLGSAEIDNGSSLGAHNYGTVVGVQGTNEVDFTVTLSPGYEFTAGGQQGFAFTTDIAVTLGTATSYYNTSPTPTATTTTWTASGNGTGSSVHDDGAGDFGGAYDNSGSGLSTPGGNILKFSITGTGLLLSDFITNGSGNLFAVDIGGICTGTGTSSPSCGMARQHWHAYADTIDNMINLLSSTPLPAALPLFGTGLGMMGLLGWRKKRKAQAVA